MCWPTLIIEKSLLSSHSVLENSPFSLKPYFIHHVLILLHRSLSYQRFFAHDLMNSNCKTETQHGIYMEVLLFDHQCQVS